MFKFEVGDRVKYIGDATHGLWLTRKIEGTPGVITKLPESVGWSYRVKFEDGGECLVGNTDNLVKLDVPAALANPSLIGPAPKPVTPPKFVAPFSTRNQFVVDVNNKTLLDVNGGATFQEDCDLAEIVAAALTEYFKEK